MDFFELHDYHLIKSVRKNLTLSSITWTHIRNFSADMQSTLVFTTHQKLPARQTCNAYIIGGAILRSHEKKSIGYSRKKR